MNEVTNFMLYMFNKWNESESVKLFGENLGHYIWNKYTNNYSDKLYFYAELDNECRQKLVDRANEIYG